MSITSEDIDLVFKYVHKAEEENKEISSALYCLEMYNKMNIEGSERAYYWLKMAMMYVVGIHHPDYIKIFDKPEVIEIPNLSEGDCIRVNAKQSWKRGFVSEKGIFKHFLKDHKGDIYGISYCIPRLDMVGTALLKDVNIMKMKG